MSFFHKFSLPFRANRVKPGSPHSIQSGFDDDDHKVSAQGSLLRRIFCGFFTYPRHPDPYKRSRKDSIMILSIRLFIVAAVLTVIIVPSAVVGSRRDRPTKREVQAVNANYVGSCAKGVCKWTGVRYAQAPVGKLRFAPSQVATPSNKRVDATKKSVTCPQDGDVSTQNEDCLFLDIYGPSKVANNVPKLPVLIFFHGGGFQFGDTNGIDPTKMITIGNKAGLPTIIISINYRLGLLGFLSSSEMLQRQTANSNDVSLNNAFHDMSTAVQWTKTNVAAFGGDPNRITIWGQSAGSFGAAAQLLKFQNNPPFQAAILESGSPGGVPTDPASTHDAQYARILSQTGCTSSQDHIDCLRNVPWQTLRNISVAEQNLTSDITTIPRGYYPWTPVQDGGPAVGGFYTGKPSDAITSNSFATVPLLHGDCLDEGTYFVTHDSNDTETTTEYIKRIYFSGSNADTLVSKLLQAYPDDPTVGSPFMPVKAKASDRFFGPTNQYKRIAAMYGDLRYQSNRRFFLATAAQRNVPVYSYLFSQYTPGTDASVGVPHGSDISYVTSQQDKNPFGSTLTLQWLSFATHQNPSTAPGLPTWPQYTSSGKQLLVYSQGKTSTMKDDFREDAIALLNSPDFLTSTSR